LLGQPAAGDGAQEVTGLAVSELGDGVADVPGGLFDFDFGGHPDESRGQPLGDREEPAPRRALGCAAGTAVDLSGQGEHNWIEARPAAANAERYGVVAYLGRVQVQDDGVRLLGLDDGRSAAGHRWRKEQETRGGVPTPGGVGVAQSLLNEVDIRGAIGVVGQEAGAQKQQSVFVVQRLTSDVVSAGGP
jgi:hypothetical protein